MEALLGLQDKMIQAHTQLKQLTFQRRTKERIVKECSLVTDQLSPLPEDVRMYRANGRAYFLASKDEILSDLKTRAEHSEKEVETLKTGQTKLEGQIKEIEQNVQELLQTSPELLSQPSLSN